MLFIAVFVEGFEAFVAVVLDCGVYIAVDVVPVFWEQVCDGVVIEGALLAQLF